MSDFPKGLKRTAAMVVLQHQDAYLLLKRNKAPNQGCYVPVGGKVDPYETPYQTAIRETWEETGITLEKVTYGGHLVETAPVEYNWWCAIYQAEIDYIPPPFCDEGVLEWVSFQDLPKLPTPPTDAAIYDYLRRGQAFALNAVYNQQLELVSMTEEISGLQLV